MALSSGLSASSPFLCPNRSFSNKFLALSACVLCSATSSSSRRGRLSFAIPSRYAARHRSVTAALNDSTTDPAEGMRPLFKAIRVWMESKKHEGGNDVSALLSQLVAIHPIIHSIAFHLTLFQSIPSYSIPSHYISSYPFSSHPMPTHPIQSKIPSNHI